MIKFILGICIGAMLGIITMCLAVSASNADKAMGIDNK